MTTHMEDGVLVRYLDRECDNDEEAAVRGHVGGCETCAARLGQLEHRSRAVRVALRAADRPARQSRPAPRWGLRAAAAMLVLLAVAGTVRPVRAWILERAEALWSALTGAPAPGAPAPAAAAPETAAVSFVPAGDAFTLEVAGRQVAGVLVVETAAGDTARATVWGGSGTESLLILPSGLRIVNPSGSTARYRVALPARLGRVRVVVEGGTPRVFDAGGPPLEIDLGGR
jgi:hypothetical protein